MRDEQVVRTAVQELLESALNTGLVARALIDLHEGRLHDLEALLYRGNGDSLTTQLRLQDGRLTALEGKLTAQSTQQTAQATARITGGYQLRAALTTALGAVLGALVAAVTLLLVQWLK